MTEHESLWRPCRDGELSEFAVRSRLRKRNQVIRRGATIMVVVVMALVAVWQWPRAVGVPDLTCREVHNLLDQYVDQRLDRPVAQRVTQHLERCRHCRQKWEDMRRDQAAAPEIESAVAAWFPDSR